jgi:3-methyladenine DNA glycosylase AlkD
VELTEAMAALDAAGTEQARSTYARHGVIDRTFGVSYAELKRLQRRIRVDHDLAVALWATGNHDARILATKVADPAHVTARLADAWVRDCTDYVTTEALGGLVARSSVARSRSDAWRDRRGEWVASCGWVVLACTASDPATWSDTELRALLGQIEAEIASRPNRVRYEMNSALIAIALRNGTLRRSAEAAARRIGLVHVDHGQTSCRTPDALAYIAKVEARRTAG